MVTGPATRRWCWRSTRISKRAITTVGAYCLGRTVISIYRLATAAVAGTLRDRTGPYDLLGSVLRIHVTGQMTYTVPADNPFVGVEGDDRVWAYGFRNPWRYSFDRVSGDLWLGDVGQGSWEEVEKVVAGGNYGWDCWEGNAVFETLTARRRQLPSSFRARSTS